MKCTNKLLPIAAALFLVFDFGGCQSVVCPNGGQLALTCNTNADGIQTDDCYRIEKTCNDVPLTGYVQICGYTLDAKGNLNALNLVSLSGTLTVTFSPNICVTLCGNLNDPTHTGQCDQPVGPVCLPGVTVPPYDLCPSSEGKFTCQVSTDGSNVCASVSGVCPDWPLQGSVSVCNLQFDVNGQLNALNLVLGSANLAIKLTPQPSLCVSLSGPIGSLGPICAP